MLPDSTDHGMQTVTARWAQMLVQANGIDKIGLRGQYFCRRAIAVDTHHHRNQTRNDGRIADRTKR